MREIFVFGSNIAGRHGAGAAKFAHQNHGAIYYQGEGLQGESYAIPTKDGRNRANLMDRSQTLSLAIIARHIRTFVEFAVQRQDLRFNITAIGCGKAGYTPAQIAPLFVDAPGNCMLPAEFQAVLHGASKPPAACVSDAAQTRAYHEISQMPLDFA
jgi:hypothetical protein